VVLRNTSDMSFLGAELRSDLPECHGRTSLVADTGRKRLVLDAYDAEAQFELYSATRQEQEQLRQAGYQLQRAADFVPAD
jgi:hypothetical protein